MDRKHPRKYALEIACFAAAFWCALQPATAQDPRPSPNPRLAVALAGVVAECIPAVEASAGRKFLRRPAVSFDNPARAKAVLEQEFIDAAKQFSPQTPPDQLRRAAQASADKAMRSLLGKYSTLDKALYLFPENAIRLAKGQNTDPAAFLDLLRVIVSHELTHALHDQYLNLAACRARIKTEDAYLAFGAVTEGFAMFVEDLCAKTLGVTEAAKRIAYDERYQEHLEPYAAREVGRTRGYSIDRYVQGQKFIAWHAQRDGIDGVWKLLANPPTTTAEIRNPDAAPSAAGDSSHPGPDVAAVWTLLKNRFQNTGWSLEISDLGAFALAHELVTGADASPLLRNVVATSQLKATKPGAGQIYSFACVASDPKAAENLFGALGVALARIVKTPRTKGPPLTDITCSQVIAGTRADNQLAVRYSVAASAESAARKTRVFILRRGTFVLQFEATNAEESDRQLIDLLEGTLLQADKLPNPIIP